MASSRHAQFPSLLAFALTRRRRRREYPPAAIAARLGIGPMDTVMDFGCGPGFFTEAFAAKAGRDVAVDAQPAMLKKARKRLGPAAARVEFVATRDGTELAVLPASVDLAFLAYVYHEVEDPVRVLSELARTLRPRGRLVIMERTEPARGPFNPPLIDPQSVEQEAGSAGFALRNRIPWSRSTLLVFEKSPASGQRPPHGLEPARAVAPRPRRFESDGAPLAAIRQSREDLKP